MGINLINIVIILFIVYFAYSGFKNGLIKELTNIIGLIVGFLLSQYIVPIIEKYLMLETFIKDQPLREKIAYLIAFIIIVFILRILGQMLEKYMDMKWKNKILGLIIGVMNGILIFSLIISIFKEILPSINIHEDWREKSYLYSAIDTLQKEYLIQYNKIRQK